MFSLPLSVNDKWQPQVDGNKSFFKSKLIPEEETYTHTHKTLRSTGSWRITTSGDRGRNLSTSSKLWHLEQNHLLFLKETSQYNMASGARKHYMVNLRESKHEAKMLYWIFLPKSVPSAVTTLQEPCLQYSTRKLCPQLRKDQEALKSSLASFCCKEEEKKGKECKSQCNSEAIFGHFLTRADTASLQRKVM